MEAYYAYEFCVDDYNQSVKAWNAYAPSHQKDTITANSHSKAEFDKVSCFGDCSYQYDTFDMARTAHLGKCGRTLNDVLKSVCDLPVYECAFIWKCRNGTLHFVGLSPANDSYYASAGDSHTANFTAAEAYSSVYWYVKSPSQTGLGTNVETDTGGSSSYSASLLYTFPSDASGDYVITAYVYKYSDSSTYETSYSVSVSSSSSSPPSDETPSCPDCTSHCSSPCSCTNSGTCNGTVTDDTPNCSDCTSHCSSPCSCSNSGTCNGTVSTPSTPSTPQIVKCAAASYTGCSGASSRTAHKVDSCGNCSKAYWTCDPNASLHTEVKRCKRSGCGASLTKCQNGPNACVRAGKPSNWHWL